MYKYIVNPKTGRKVRTTGKIGRKVLKQYFNQVGGDFECEDTYMEYMNKHTLNHYANDLEKILVDNSEIRGRNVLLLGDGNSHGWEAIKLIAKFIIKNELNIKLGNVYLEYHNVEEISEDYQYVSNRYYMDEIELIERAGFKVIGLENTITSPENATEEFSRDHRILLSNPLWTRIINETIEPNKLNIVSVGSSHNFTFGKKIGLKDLLIDYGISVSLYEVTLDCEMLLPNTATACCVGYDVNNEVCSSLPEEEYPKNINKILTDLDPEAPPQNVDIIYNFGSCMDEDGGAAGAGE